MERLHKVLAAAGVASRRKCEELIAAGRVKVNGRVVTAAGTKVSPHDLLEVDNRVVRRPARVYYLLNKPAGYVSTAADTHGRPKVTDLVPPWPRVYPVGRLDLDTRGLLPLTNDGELTNALLHPSSQVEKVYRVTVAGRVSQQDLARLARGIELDDGPTAPARLRLLSLRGAETVVEMAIHEGRKRQIKRMFQAVGHKVTGLERVRFAFLTLGNLKPGQYRELTPREVRALKKFARRGDRMAGK